MCNFCVLFQRFQYKVKTSVLPQKRFLNENEPPKKWKYSCRFKRFSEGAFADESARNFHKMHLQGNLFNLMRYLVSQVLEFIAIYTAEYQYYLLKSILCSRITRLASHKKGYSYIANNKRTNYFRKARLIHMHFSLWVTPREIICTGLTKIWHGNMI